MGDTNHGDTPSRMSAARRRACSPCSAAKVKCDEKPGGCSRCRKRRMQSKCIYGRAVASPEAQLATGLPTNGFHDDLSFDALDLVCSIDPEKIRDRWQKPWLQSGDEKIKSYPAHVIALESRMLKAYAARVSKGNLPPFVHHAQGKSTAMATCFSLARLCDAPLHESRPIVQDTLQREMQRLLREHQSYNEIELLATFQAYLIYGMLIYYNFDQDGQSGPYETMVNMKEIAFEVCKRGLVSSAELAGSRPAWESWIVAEAKRRTVYTMYIFDSVLCVREGLPTYLSTELTSTLAPAGQSLWRATTREQFTMNYNAHLHEWVSGGLRIEELWPNPLADVAVRGRRIDSWLAEVDELGVFLYAITSGVHGS